MERNHKAYLYVVYAIYMQTIYQVEVFKKYKSSSELNFSSTVMYWHQQLYNELHKWDSEFQRRSQELYYVTNLS